MQKWLKRDAYSCPCGGWRWCDVADQRGETQCLHCKRPFSVAEPWPFTPKGGEPQSGGVAMAHKGQKGTGGVKGGHKGGPAGGGKGGPKAVGPQAGAKAQAQDRLQTGGQKDVINYKRAQSDPLYKQQVHLDHCRKCFGDRSEEAMDAHRKYEAAQQAALARRAPAQRAEALRAERVTCIEAMGKQLARAADLEHRSRCWRTGSWHWKYTAGSCLSRPPRLTARSRSWRWGYNSLGHRGLRSQHRTAYRERCRRSSGWLRRSARRQVFRTRPTRTLLIGRPKQSEENMDDEPEEDRRAKAARREEPEDRSIGTAVQAAQEEPGWATVLRPQARKALREANMAKKTLAEIEEQFRKQSMQSSSAHAKGA